MYRFINATNIEDKILVFWKEKNGEIIAISVSNQVWVCLPTMHEQFDIYPEGINLFPWQIKVKITKWSTKFEINDSPFRFKKSFSLQTKIK